MPTIKFVTGDIFLASIKLVPRHSYNSENLYPDSQKVRHGLFILVVCRDSAPKKNCGHNLHSQTNTNALYCRAVSKNAAGILASLSIMTNLFWRWSFLIPLWPFPRPSPGFVTGLYLTFSFLFHDLSYRRPIVISWLLLSALLLTVSNWFSIYWQICSVINFVIIWL